MPHRLSLMATDPTAANDASPRQRVDGRSSRWDAHRARRRVDIVDATVRAIQKHGAGVGMDTIAAMAGTSKPVLYRYFGDRAGLHDAICERVEETILKKVGGVLEDCEEQMRAGRSPRASTVVRACVEAYLTVIERDPDLYAFVTARSADSQSNSEQRIVRAVAARMARLVALGLERNGKPSDPAETWGHGFVGFVFASADHWLAQEDRRPREEIVEIVTGVFGPFLDGVMRSPDASAKGTTD